MTALTQHSELASANAAYDHAREVMEGSDILVSYPTPCITPQRVSLVDLVVYLICFQEYLIFLQGFIATKISLLLQL